MLNWGRQNTASIRLILGQHTNQAHFWAHFGRKNKIWLVLGENRRRSDEVPSVMRIISDWGKQGPQGVLLSEGSNGSKERMSKRFCRYFDIGPEPFSGIFHRNIVAY